MQSLTAKAEKYFQEFSVPDRIVSISQPLLQTMERSQIRSEPRHGRIWTNREDIFHPHNAEVTLQETGERFRERIGGPGRPDIQDRIRDNRRYCKGIRPSGLRVGRPSAVVFVKNRKQEY